MPGHERSAVFNSGNAFQFAFYKIANGSADGIHQGNDEQCPAGFKLPKSNQKDEA